MGAEILARARDINRLLAEAQPRGRGSVKMTENGVETDVRLAACSVMGNIPTQPPIHGSAPPDTPRSKPIAPRPLRSQRPTDRRQTDVHGRVHGQSADAPSRWASGPRLPTRNGENDHRQRPVQTVAPLRGTHPAPPTTRIRRGLLKLPQCLLKC